MPYFEIIVGTFITVFGLYLFIILLTARTKGYITTGMVEELVSEWHWNGNKLSVTYHPMVSFKDINADKVILKFEFGTFPPIYSQGQRLIIAYYEGKIYPYGLGWLIIAALIAITGILVILIQLFEFDLSSIIS